MTTAISGAQSLYERAKKLIPGGTQLLSKRPELFAPGVWPVFYSRAKGIEVWDLDDKRYVDMSYMGIGACILGYADDDVNTAVKDAINTGSMTTLNVSEEVELAQLMTDLHPWADMARFARTGGEAVAMAVRIARAKKGKDRILFCGYHGWHDWYLSANLSDDGALDGHLLPGLEPKGVPRLLAGTSVPFYYNDIEGFKSLFETHKDALAAVVMEPLRNRHPEEGFLETIREMTEQNGVALIFDEISSGWRMEAGGAHLGFGINPDIAVFGKAMSNGFPMAAVIGTEKVMSAAQESFISSTYWTDRTGPVASLKTIEKIKTLKVPEHLMSVGRQVQEGWSALSLKHNLNIDVSGIYPMGHFSFNYPNSQAIKTLFVQSMLEKGFLATNAFYASYAHKKEDIDNYLNAVDEVFSFISDSIKEDSIERKLKGAVAHSGFKRLT
jgi:glutamate-1-semialdehyde aminotransferase